MSPGFIDLHSHAQNIYGQTYQVRDGVTTALELEWGKWGTESMPELLDKRQGSSLINYGYSAGYAYGRYLEKGEDEKKTYHEIADAAEREHIFFQVKQDLNNGAIGIGLPLDYFSRGVNDSELEGLFRLAAKYQMPLFIHIRVADQPDNPRGFQELIDMARKTGASFHMVHIVSTGLQRVPLYIDMMERARAEGLDITTELYPYTASSTGINSGIFDHDWQSKFSISYGDIEWPPTGERFTGKKMWDEYRKKYPEGIVIQHKMKEQWVDAAIRHPGIMIASDSMEISSLEQRAHPRGMGTYSRVLGRYVREKKMLSLPEAISKMSYLPAKRLEAFTPMMTRKGRLQVGADADITIFNPDTVIDRATYIEPNQFSEGIIHVIVSGQIVVKSGSIRKGIFPGKPINTRSH